MPTKKSERTKQYRLRYPIRYHWHRLRWRSKQRSIICTISYEDFEAFCIENNYHEGTGLDGKAKTIDRKIEELGYVKGNLQILTRIDNTNKENDRRKGIEWKPVIIDEENPF